MNIKEIVVNDKVDFLNYLKSKFQLFHNSNIFFRDLHYGLMSYIQGKHGRKVSYTKGEILAQHVCEEFELEGIFSKIDHQSWRLNYPEFVQPKIEKKAS